MSRKPASRSARYSWSLWPRMEPAEAERAYAPAFLVGVDAPICFALAAVFFLPPVRAWSGAIPGVVLAGFSVHVVVHLLLMATRAWARSPRVCETLSQLANWTAVASVALATGANTVLVWGLFLFVSGLHAISGKSVAGVVLAFAAAFFAPAFVALTGWPVQRAFADFAFESLPMALIAVIVHVVVGYYRDWSREIHSEEVTRAHADAASAERERIGRSLHGTLGAALSEITLWHEVALAGSGRDASSSDDPLTRAQARARSALTELRALVAGMDEEPATARGLFDSLRERAGGLCAAAGVSFSLEGEAGAGGSPEAPVSQATAYHVAKIVVEGVTNAVRHGRPASIRASLSLSPLCLEVVDDGRGFDPASVPPGRGLRSLREHAEALGASLEIISSVGEGTRIVVTGGAA